MKRLPFLTAAVLTLLPLAATSWAGDAKTELGELVSKVKQKLAAGKPTEEGLSDEFKAFDALLEAHRAEKTDDVAQIVVMKAMLYGQVLKKEDKAVAELKKLQADFPDTAVAKKVPDLIASLEKRAASESVQRSLTEGAMFPDFQEKDLDGKPLSVSQYKGKVVLVDFWATWCGPCVAELPNVQKAYEKYHGRGFEIVGVSLDQDKDKLTKFLAEKKMPWQQYFDGKGWQNKVSTQYGVNSIPATYLIDKEGKIIGSDLRGPALESALEAALK